MTSALEGGPGKADELRELSKGRLRENVEGAGQIIRKLCRRHKWKAPNQASPSLPSLIAAALSEQPSSVGPTGGNAPALRPHKRTPRTVGLKDGRTHSTADTLREESTLQPHDILNFSRGLNFNLFFSGNVWAVIGVNDPYSK